MKELVICSGKGGTGKTSVVASLAALADEPVLVDCDVDAADLHLILAPEIGRREEFRSGREAVIREADCLGCGTCRELCAFGAVVMRPVPDGPTIFAIDPLFCEGCGVCVHFCPEEAIDFPEAVCGQWFVSGTRHGPMVHARLGIGAGNSGKLVTLVRQEARKVAAERGRDLILVDGPPGIGCPVIASLTGADLALIVTEPTVSGLHDLERVVDLARHFGIPVTVCINKHDINPDMTGRISTFCRERSLPVTGLIPYDPQVTAAQLEQIAVVESNGSPAGAAIQAIWTEVQRFLAR